VLEKLPTDAHYIAKLSSTIKHKVQMIL